MILPANVDEKKNKLKNQKLEKMVTVYGKYKIFNLTEKPS
jgi:hypothetical protein